MAITQVAENYIYIMITIYQKMNDIDCSIETEKRWKLREEVGRKCGGTSGEDILAQYNVTPAIAIKDADRVGNQRK